MADNMCGPSTALKSFSEHVNRDRSVHQDRAAQGRAGPSNFRSTPAGTLANEAEVRAFTAGAAFQAEPLGVVPDMHGGGSIHPAALQQMAPPMGPQMQRGPGLPARLAAPGGAHAGWAAEFAATAAAAPAGHQTRAGFAPQQPLQAVDRLQHFSSGMMAPGPLVPVPMAAPSFAGPAFAPMPSFAQAPALAAPAAAAVRAGDAPSGVAGLTEAELEARFAAVENDFAFEAEMSSWMAAHGPTAAERGEAAQTEDVDAILESLANELDAQRLAESTAETAEAAATAEQPVEEEPTPEQRDLAKDQDDLARTAGQILHTLDAHPNQRFQQSSFLSLMRRIHTREVTVNGNDLVEEATGRPIEPAAPPADAAEATPQNSAA